MESCSSTTKNISPLPQCLRPPNLTGWWLTKRASHQKHQKPFDHMVLLDHVTKWNHQIPLPQCPWLPNLAGSIPLSHITLWSRGLDRSCNKLRALYFHYHNDVPWGAPVIESMTLQSRGLARSYDKLNTLNLH